MPHVHAYSICEDNAIGSPYILMDYVEGKTLHELEFQKGGRTPRPVVEKVYSQVADVYRQLERLEFSAIGALGFTESSTEKPSDCDPDSISVVGRPLTVGMALQEIEGYNPGCIIQPGETFLTAKAFTAALVRLSDNYLQKAQDLGLDMRRGRSLLYAYDSFHRYANDAWLRDHNGPFVLMHGDFSQHPGNAIFSEDFELQGVLDWEWSFVAPVQFLAPPLWLTGSGLAFVLDEFNWYSSEVEKLLRVAYCTKHGGGRHTSSTLSPQAAYDALVTAALLHPDVVYEVFWCVLYRQWFSLDLKNSHLDFGDFSRDVILPHLDAFLTPGREAFLSQKYQEQFSFWADERKFIPGAEAREFMDAKALAYCQVYESTSERKGVSGLLGHVPAQKRTMQLNEELPNAHAHASWQQRAAHDSLSKERRVGWGSIFYKKVLKVKTRLRRPFIGLLKNR